MTETLLADGLLGVTERAGRVTVRFNNPARLNAMTLGMWQALGDVATGLNPDTRVVVLTGTGPRAFVSGADISEFATLRSTRAQIATYNATVARALDALAALPMPVVARISGYCIGGGLEIATRCDLRLAAETARFAFTPAKLGLAVATNEIAALTRLIGPSATADLLYTARQVSADEALRWGLVNEVVPEADLDAAADTLVTRIASNAPLTIRAVKAALRAGPDPDDATRTQIADMVQACYDSADYAEGQAAFAAKRVPAFQGR